jgi:imidazolonepropionase-like amidohydrolase
MTRTVLTGGRVFDGTGREPEIGDVALENGRIVGLGTGLDGDVAVDVRNRTILPGLFDCHVHVCFSDVDLWAAIQKPFSLQFYEAAGNLQKTLAIGITSVRDAGGADLGIKEAVDRGLIAGPRMQISIIMLSQTGGHGDDWYPSGSNVPDMAPHPGRPSGIVDGPDEVRRKVRELRRAGADVIKVATSGGVLSARDDPRHAHLRPAELDVLVEEATAAGLFVMAHAQGADGIKNAVRAGIRSIEHGIYLDDEAIELMLRRGTWFVPTLVAPQGVLDAVAGGVSLPPAVVDKARMVLDIHRAAFRRAVDAGVRIAMGTDSGVTPHGGNLRELQLMADGGMAPAAVLEATTRSAAELLGVDDELGTIEEGKIADLVVVAGDPYDFSDLGERIEQVWKDGARVVEPGGFSAGSPRRGTPRQRSCHGDGPSSGA